MRFAVEGKFKSICADVLPWPLPWDETVSLLILRSNSREHRRWLMEQSSNVLTAKIIGRVMREDQVNKRPSPEQPTDAADAADAVDAAPYKTFEQTAHEILLEELESGNPGALSLVGGGVEDRKLQAIHLVKGWPGMKEEDGSPAAFTPENLRRLVESDMFIEEGYGVGLTLGEAVINYIHECSEKHDAYRVAYLEGAEKNFVPSSAGN